MTGFDGTMDIIAVFVFFQFFVNFMHPYFCLPRNKSIRKHISIVIPRNVTLALILDVVLNHHGVKNVLFLCSED